MDASNNTRLPEDVLGLLDIQDVTLTEEKDYTRSLVQSESTLSTWTATFEGTVYLRAHRFEEGPAVRVSRSAATANEALQKLYDATRKQHWEFKGA